MRKRMLRLVVTMLGVIMLGMTMQGVTATPAMAEQMTWKIRSSYDYQVQLEFYSQDRKAAWPGNDRAYSLKDSAVHTFTLQCQRGEKICYGAWPTGGGKTYWGVGPRNAHACKTCCAICGLDNPSKELSN